MPIANKGFGNELIYTREWVQTTLMPGIRPELAVTAHPQVKDLTYEVLTPRQIKVTCSVLVTINEVMLEQEPGPIRLRRKHQTRAGVIPRAVSQLDVVTIIPVPDQQLPVKKVNSFEIECRNPVNTVMRNRVITKAQMQFRLKYTAFATRDTVSGATRGAQSTTRTAPNLANPAGR